MKKWCALFPFFLAPALVLSFEIEPWFGDVFEFQFRSSYIYSRYTRVQDSVESLGGPSNDQQLFLNLGVPLSENWDVEIELEGDETPRQSWGLRSFALQCRRLWMDDLLGDFFSLTTGLTLRGVPQHRLKDVSCPYHGAFNAELNAAIGKEWSQGEFWRFHPFAFAGIGMANRGSPWVRFILAFQSNKEDRHRYEVSLRNYFGFGGKHKVNIRHFHGYGPIHHQSIDIGAGYSYVFDLWGSLTFEYAYRLYARSFPERVSFFLISYQLPFSLL